MPPTTSPIENPPDRLRFSLWQMLLAVTALAVYLGLLRWIGPLAFYYAIAVWVMLLFLQLESEIRATLLLLAQIVGGGVIPLSLLFLSPPTLALDPIPKWILFICACWGLGILLWVVVLLFRLPRISAIACGYLTTFAGIFTWIGGGVPLVSNRAVDPETSSNWQTVLALATVTACIAAGFVVGITFFAAAVQAWQRSSRNLFSWMLAALGMVLAVALPFAVLRLFLD